MRSGTVKLRQMISLMYGVLSCVYVIHKHECPVFSSIVKYVLGKTTLAEGLDVSMPPDKAALEEEKQLLGKFMVSYVDKSRTMSIVLGKIWNAMIDVCAFLWKFNFSVFICMILLTKDTELLARFQLYELTREVYNCVLKHTVLFDRMPFVIIPSSCLVGLVKYKFLSFLDSTACVRNLWWT